MMGVINRIRQFIRENRLLEPGGKGVVAVSGGPDSVALLHVFAKVLGPEYGTKIIAAHLNHSLRKEGSDADAEFVRALCRDWGVRLCDCVRDVATTKPNGESIESWARIVRYGFLLETARDAGANWIATGHTASDQAETILMRVMEGAGIRGLQGILVSRADGVIRPFLCVGRKDVLAYLHENRIAYRIDESNSDTRYLRNRIRHTVLPDLVRQRPNYEQDLLRIAADARRTWSVLSTKVAVEAGQVISRSNDGHFCLDLRVTLSYPTYVLREFLAKMVRRPAGVHIRALQKLCDSQPGRSIKVPGLRVWRTTEGLLAIPNKNSNYAKIYVANLGTPVAMEREGVLALSTLVEKPSGYPAASASEALLDADSVGETWRYRFWREGDSFSPLGLGGKRKKISDLLCEKKIPVPQRRETMIMETQNGIAWVIGHRIGEPFRVRADSRRILRVCFIHKELSEV